VAWGLVVWAFGESFGGIFAPGLTVLFGAPGAVLIYVVAGALLALPERAWDTRRPGRLLLGGAGAFFLGMALLQAWPGRGFWQGTAGGKAGSLAAMVQSMAGTTQPRATHAIVSWFAGFAAAHGFAVNLVAVIALALIGGGLTVAAARSDPRLARIAVVAGAVFCLADWVLVEDFGFFGGLGTDPNSMIPLILLLGAGYLGIAPSPATATATSAVLPGIESGALASSATALVGVSGAGLAHASVTPAALTQDSVTQAALTPASVTPASLTPASTHITEISGMSGGSAPDIPEARAARAGAETAGAGAETAEVHGMAGPGAGPVAESAGSRESAGSAAQPAADVTEGTSVSGQAESDAGMGERPGPAKNLTSRADVSESPGEPGAGERAGSAHRGGRASRLVRAFAGAPIRAVVGIGAVGVIVVGAAPMAFASVNRTADPVVAQALAGTAGEPNTPAPGFTLTSQDGRQVSLAGLRGKVVLLTFLDPVCTTDCPLIAQEMRSADTMLGAKAGNTELVAVVANPTYISTSYTRAFTSQENLSQVPNWLYLTGSLSQLADVWHHYGIEVEDLPAGAMAAHNDLAFVISAGGTVRQEISDDPGPGTAATKSSFADLLANSVLQTMSQP
jgi:cytochrome oxidase Cu insertion factor (SCO1/SenC/PrrC family)